MTGAIRHWNRMLGPILLLAACSSTQPDPVPVNKTLTVTAGPSINEYNGGPNPVVLRIYQLGSRAEFDGADFWAIFNNTSSDLAGSVVDQQSLSPIYPEERRLVAIDLQPDVFFLGVFAEFADFSDQSFVATAPVSETILDAGITVTVTTSGVAIKSRQEILEEADQDGDQKGFFARVLSAVGLGG